ncbi:MAG: type II toxin-antitoxin system RelE/ParE family toxin [Myxococcaceae bacterium]
MELEWTPAALEDLDTALDFIAKDKPSAARKMAGRIEEAVDSLVEHPNLGRSGRVKSTRELVVSGTPFLIVYVVLLDQVQILRVLHHARAWPGS